MPEILDPDRDVEVDEETPLIRPPSKLNKKIVVSGWVLAAIFALVLLAINIGTTAADFLPNTIEIVNVTVDFAPYMHTQFGIPLIVYVTTFANYTAGTWWQRTASNTATLLVRQCQASNITATVDGSTAHADVDDAVYVGLRPNEFTELQLNTSIVPGKPISPLELVISTPIKVGLCFLGCKNAIWVPAGEIEIRKTIDIGFDDGPGHSLVAVDGVRDIVATQDHVTGVMDAHIPSFARFLSFLPSLDLLATAECCYGLLTIGRISTGKISLPNFGTTATDKLPVAISFEYTTSDDLFGSDCCNSTSLIGIILDGFMKANPEIIPSLHVGLDPYSPDPLTRALAALQLKVPLPIKPLIGKFGKPQLIKSLDLTNVQLGTDDDMNAVISSDVRAVMALPIPQKPDSLLTNVTSVLANAILVYHGAEFATVTPQEPSLAISELDPKNSSQVIVTSSILAAPLDITDQATFESVITDVLFEGQVKVGMRGTADAEVEVKKDVPRFWVRGLPVEGDVVLGR
ncbi:hypothetical protein CANCADRAFT_122908 [Tortispora caseinolytica NRRL Y-17796]|uniref:Tag1 C-terminal domain-containing protein n=1 Tax=Tortispora caseinolytica NRRL Y-17796 TaxID=767744 RepID=A0A1E4THW5_9ASCO|nr:hypothetical protein CANCADRAFT_122908 [Tortispora caseinolytica NRRL Y-17796]